MHYKAVFLFPSCSDTDTVVGLPRPIHESIKTLKQVLQRDEENKTISVFYAVCDHFIFILFFQHKYISVAEIQMAKEEEYQKTPLSVVGGN